MSKIIDTNVKYCIHPKCTNILEPSNPYDGYCKDHSDILHSTIEICSQCKGRYRKLILYGGDRMCTSCILKREPGRVYKQIEEYKGKLNTKQIAKDLGKKEELLRSYLGILYDVGLVKRRKNGKFYDYSVDGNYETPKNNQRDQILRSKEYIAIKRERDSLKQELYNLKYDEYKYEIIRMIKHICTPKHAEEVIGWLESNLKPKD